MRERPRRVDKLAAALASGQLWRAKEILAGRVGSSPFDPDLCEQLGRVLLQMGDTPQAGKYLFLSGAREPEYQESIALFLRRHSRAGWQSLLSTFPASARRAAWTDLPARVREELRAVGVPNRPGNEPLSTTIQRHPPGSIGWVGCVGVLIVLVLIGLGVAAVVSYFVD